MSDIIAFNFKEVKIISKIIEFDIKGDDRGSLIAIENSKEIPFEIKRVYYIFDTKEGVARGFHAHKNLQQVLICVRGSCVVKLDDGENVEEILLDRSDRGLFLDKLVWREMHKFSNDCVLLVLADQLYDLEDYIQSYSDFKNMVMKECEE